MAISDFFKNLCETSDDKVSVSNQAVSNQAVSNIIDEKVSVNGQITDTVTFQPSYSFNSNSSQYYSCKVSALQINSNNIITASTITNLSFVNNSVAVEYHKITEFADIIHLSESNSAVKDALDNLYCVYKLSKNEKPND